MSLTQTQRNKIRYALEDAGVPEVLAFMAARNATTNPSRLTQLTTLFVWHESPEGHDFWQMVHAEHCAVLGTHPWGFPNLHVDGDF